MATPSVASSETTSTLVADTGTGKTVIHDSVIAKITGIAVREVPGVYALGGGTARALGAIRGVMGNTDLSQGCESHSLLFVTGRIVISDG